MPPKFEVLPRSLPLWIKQQLNGVTLLLEHRFQIFKMVGVKFHYLFLLIERLQRNLNYFTVNLPLGFSEMFSIFRITVLFFFFRNSGKLLKKI